MMYCLKEMTSRILLSQVDILYYQSMMGIADIDESGVTEENFHEVIPLDCIEGQSSDGRFIPIVPGRDLKVKCTVYLIF